jgi:hypothetical protein
MTCKNPQTETPLPNKVVSEEDLEVGAASNQGQSLWEAKSAKWER